MGHRASLTLLVVVVLHVLAAAACTRRNEGYCCTSADLCDDVGGILQECPSGEICDDDGSLASGPAHTCISDPAAMPCQGREDCEAPTPACVDRVCVECEQDEDCESATEPVCDLDLHRCGDCSDNSQCDRFGEGVCGPDGNCVECTAGTTPAQSGECPVERPICETNGACRVCGDHRECASGACDVAVGVCVDAEDIAYVDAAAADTNLNCTEAAPCRTILRGLQAGGGSRRWLAIAAGAYDEDVAISDRTVSLIGYGAQLRAATNGAAAVSVGGAGGAVEVIGMELRQSATGLDCNGDTGSTVSATLIDALVTTHTSIGVNAYRCDLVMQRTRVTASVGGGVSLIQAGFDITNSIIDGNGALGTFGGIVISAPQPAPQRIAFNTIAGNETDAGTAPAGIDCVGISPMDPFHSNIITDNAGGPGGAQVSGQPNCTYAYSLINPDFEGTGNLVGDPMFGADYRIGAESDAIDVAAENSGITVDIDGEDRPATTADVGADEYHPPS
jgi:hypothetical protein